MGFLNNILNAHCIGLALTQLTSHHLIPVALHLTHTVEMKAAVAVKLHSYRKTSTQRSNGMSCNQLFLNLRLVSDTLTCETMD